MDRRVSIVAVCVTALLAASGCQDYNFNPVGHCLIQPGTSRVTLSSVSTADVLFVVDDSGSMATEQLTLGANFNQFLTVLAAENQARDLDPDLEPVDFHIAVTSTSVFYNQPPAYNSICTDQCPTAPGSLVCCLYNSDFPDPKLTYPQSPLCSTSAAPGDPGLCSGSNVCQGDTNGWAWLSSTSCGNATTKAPERIACSTKGEPCGDLDQYYKRQGVCDMSYLAASSSELRTVPFPQGEFMAAPGNLKVTHFTRDLNWAGGASDPTLAPLVTEFSENVDLGTCGSAEEQGLEAAKLAVEKALAGRQAVPRCPSSWTPSDPTSCWPHPDSKLVVVWVTDENDASSPISAATGVVATTPDSNDLAAEARKYPVARYADFFTSLGRPFGAAFVTSVNKGCGIGTTACSPGACCESSCTGSESGSTRYFELSEQLAARGVDVVRGSICDPFGATLAKIGEIVVPPKSLFLPTQPAASVVTILRIARPDGSTRKTCSPPASKAPATFPGGLPPAAPLPAGAWTEPNAQAYIQSLAEDWWFTTAKITDTSSWQDRLPAAATQYVYINHATGDCEANAGETYSADFIGNLPAMVCDEDGLCSGGCDSADDCLAALGGTDVANWTCYKAVVGRPGTCLCAGD